MDPSPNPDPKNHPMLLTVENETWGDADIAAAFRLAVAIAVPYASGIEGLVQNGFLMIRGKATGARQQQQLVRLGHDIPGVTFVIDRTDLAASEADAPTGAGSEKASLPRAA